jgi:hypothetical protein
MECFQKMFHAGKRKPRITLNSPLTKTSKKKKKKKKHLKQKTIYLCNDSTPKTTMLRNQWSKNKSHTLKLMILLSSSSLGRRRIPTS